MNRGAALLTAIFLSAALPARSQEARTLDLDSGARVNYTLTTHAPDAHLQRPAKDLAPTSPLQAAQLLNLHLSTGDIEEAALLSNAPRRRFEVLRDYRDSVGAEEFKRVFAQYFAPENRLLAEIAIDRHRLLIWDLREGSARISGQYFVEVEGRYLVDDVPNDKRTQLRWVLEAYRAGKLPR